MRTALFVLSTGHVALRELRPVLERFRAGGWRVVVRLGASGPEAPSAAAELSSEGMDAAVIPPGVGYEAQTAAVDSGIDPDEATPAPPVRDAQAGARTVAREALKKVLRPVLAHRLVAFWRYYRQALRNREWADRLVDEIAPDVVLLNMFHSVGEIDNAVQRAARRARLPLFCLTNAPYVGEAIQLVSRMNHLQSGMAGPDIRADYDILNRLLAALFKRWTRQLPSGPVVFYWDPVRILAANLAGLGMNRLWLKPSVDFDKVFVFGEFSRTLLLEAGYPREKIVVAGQPLLDDILRLQGDPVRQADIASHIGVPRGAGFLLVNIEPSFEHNYASAADHWTHFHELMRACVDHGVAVVLSLHPLCKPEDYRFAEAQYGLRISTRFKIHELYPLCTVSVSFPCSTNVLALTFEKPLVIYDFYRVLERDPVTDRLYWPAGALLGRSDKALRAHIAAALATAKRAAATHAQRENACAAILETVSAELPRKTAAAGA